MQRNHPIAQLYVALRRGGETLSVPVVSSDLFAPSAVTQWHSLLLKVSDIALRPVLAQLTRQSLVAALRLLPPDFPILAILADLFGYEGL
jgi:hypothetical protein